MALVEKRMSFCGAKVLVGLSVLDKAEMLALEIRPHTSLGTVAGYGHEAAIRSNPFSFNID